MENREERKSILIPVFDVCNIPPLEKVVGLANKTNLRIHFAGFVSGIEPSNLMAQTIRMTRIMRIILHKLKGKVKSVSSKIYTNSRNEKVKKLIENEQVSVVVSKRIDKKLLSITHIDNVMFLQLSNSREKAGVNTCFVKHHNENNGKIKGVKEVLSLFGGSTNYIYDHHVISKEKRMAISNLVTDVDIKHVLRKVNCKKTDCIALEKDVINGDKASLEILNQNDASILLY